VIAILDYGVGNLGSLVNMFKRIGSAVTVESDLEILQSADKIVLPGVGAFDTAMTKINEAPGLRDVLDQIALVDRKPILGVCLGMQLVTDGSDEGVLPGLGWISGRANRFPAIQGLKIPHMGWNTATSSSSHALTVGADDDSRYYFAHSYYVTVNDRADSIMKTHHGIDFDSAINHANISGVQFHPEKSHRFGMQILRNFASD
jgi:glutamine amidotransferase